MEESDALLEAPLDSPLFNDREKAALRFVEEVTKDVSPSLAAFAEVRKYYNADQIVELSAIAGIWCMWNRMVEVSKPDFDDDVYAKLAAAGLTGRLLPETAI